MYWHAILYSGYSTIRLQKMFYIFFSQFNKFVWFTFNYWRFRLCINNIIRRDSKYRQRQ